jgi:hypothetical protein
LKKFYYQSIPFIKSFTDALITLSVGSVDGVTARPELSEDGFPLIVGLSVIDQLRELVRRYH